jgi:hypothetical protein
MRWRSLLLAGSAGGRSIEIGATADQDRHRPDRQDHVDDWPVVEQIMMEPLRSAAVPSMHGFQMYQRRGRRCCTAVAPS